MYTYTYIRNISFLCVYVCVYVYGPDFIPVCVRSSRKLSLWDLQSNILLSDIRTNVGIYYTVPTFVIHKLTGDIFLIRARHIKRNFGFTDCIRVHNTPLGTHIQQESESSLSYLPFINRIETYILLILILLFYQKI